MTATHRSGSTLPPLSRDRIEQSLDRLEFSHFIDDDGDVAGEWDLGFFYFLVRGEFSEIFIMQGVWRGALAESDYLMTQEICNAWNEQKLWPTAYVNRDDNGNVWLRVEHAVDYEHGLTDAQLDQHIIGALMGSLQLFEQAADAFPEVWERVR